MMFDFRRLTVFFWQKVHLVKILVTEFANYKIRDHDK